MQHPTFIGTPGKKKTLKINVSFCQLNNLMLENAENLTLNLGTYLIMILFIYIYI